MELFHVEHSKTGVVRRFYSDDKGNITVDTQQDLQELVDYSKRVQVDRGKKITSDYANPIGMVPPVFVVKWLNEEGWSVFDADKDPSVEKKLKAKLNSNEFMWLRTSELRV